MLVQVIVPKYSDSWLWLGKGMAGDARDAGLAAENGFGEKGEVGRGVLSWIRILVLGDVGVG